MKELLLKNRWNVVLFLLIFIGTFVFFALANPLVVWDGDDWINLSYMRKPFPYWKQWNPTKLLPEILMPFVGYVAAYLVNPVVQDYIASITYVSAFLTALGISVFSLLAGLYVCKLVELPRQRAGIFALILTLLSFLIFKKNQYDNTFLFFTGNLTCYYHYVFPFLVNGITVLTLCLAGDLRTAFHSWSRARQAGFLLLCWFSLFSNIMQSVIIATYALSKIVESYVLRFDKRPTLANARVFFLSNRGYFYIGAVWLLSLLMEANGGRATQIGRKVSVLSLPFGEAFRHWYRALAGISPYFLALVLAAIAIGIYYCVEQWRSRERDYSLLREIGRNFFCCVLISVYVIVVASKAGPGYAGNPSVQGSGLIFGLFVMLLLFGYLLKKQPKLEMCVPLLLLMLTVVSVDSGKHYRAMTVRNVNPKLCKAVDEDLIRQIQDADRKGLKEMTLIVPKGDNRDNWPHPNYMGANIARTLYTHGLITRVMPIKIKPDPQMLERIKCEKLYK